MALQASTVDTFVVIGEVGEALGAYLRGKPYEVRNDRYHVHLVTLLKGKFYIRAKHRNDEVMTRVADILSGERLDVRVESRVDAVYVYPA